MTSNNDTEIKECLRTLITTTNNTYFMHESFDRNDPANFTRSWFAWVNSLFGEFVVHIYNTKPYIL